MNNDFQEENKITIFENKKQKIKREYLLAIKKINEKKCNKGEKDEVLVLLKLFYLDQTKQYDQLVQIFGNEANEGIQFLDMDTNHVITDITTLSKAKSGFKADCKFKMRKSEFIYCPSIKSKNGAKPTILNHTPRTAKVFAENGILYDYIADIDLILSEYIVKRSNKIFGEDVQITKLESVKEPSVKNKFMEILSYFVFDGTGKGISKCKANSMIEFKDEKIIFTKCCTNEETKEYIKMIFPNCVVSLRNKGMPKVISEYCKPWLFKDTKKDGVIIEKAALHIRIK